MKNITITLDLKSLCIGALGVFAIMSLSNFNKSNEPKNDPADEVRRYQAVPSQQGLVILDSKTGKFLVCPGYVAKGRWVKGDFNTKHNDESTKAE